MVLDPVWWCEEDGGRVVRAPHVSIVGAFIAAENLTQPQCTVLTSLGYATDEPTPLCTQWRRNVPALGRFTDSFALQLLHALGLAFSLGPDWNPYDSARHRIGQGLMFGPLRRTVSRTGGYVQGYDPSDWPDLPWEAGA